MNLPDDPMMLFSVINMKLRDCYASLDSLCDDMNVDKKAIVCKLARRASSTTPPPTVSGEPPERRLFLSGRACVAACLAQAYIIVYSGIYYCIL